MKDKLSEEKKQEIRNFIQEELSEDENLYFMR